MKALSLKRYRLPAYGSRFSLSLRDVKELMEARGINVSYDYPLLDSEVRSADRWTT